MKFLVAVFLISILVIINIILRKKNKEMECPKGIKIKGYQSICASCEQKDCPLSKEYRSEDE